MTIVGSYEVLDSTGSSFLKPVSTDEVVCELVLCCVGGCAVHDGHGAVALDTVPIVIDFGHLAGNYCSLETSGSSVVTSGIDAEDQRGKGVRSSNSGYEFSSLPDSTKYIVGRLNVQKTHSGCFGGIKEGLKGREVGRVSVL
jgi:hypothetical protein